MNKKVWLLSAGFFLISLGFTGPHRFTTVLFQGQQQVKTGFLSLLLIYGFFAAGSLIASRVISRFGLVKTMAAASIIYGVYVLGLSRFSVVWLMIVSGLLGVGAALLYGAQSIYLAKVSPGDRRGLSAGVFQGANSLGSFISVLILGWRTDFAVAAGLVFLGSVLLFFLKPAKPALDQIPKIDFGGQFRLVSNRRILRLMLLWFVMTYSTGFTIASLPLMTIRYFSWTGTGAIGSLYWLFPLVFALTAGFFSDKLGRTAVIRWGLVSGALGALLLLAPQSFTIVMATLFLSVSFAILRTVSYAVLPEISQEKDLAAVNSLHWLASSLGVVAAVGVGMAVSVAVSVLIFVGLSLLSVVGCWPAMAEKSKIPLNEIRTA